MKLLKTLTCSLGASVLVATTSYAPLANAEVEASVGVANMYLWRGFDLGFGDAAVFGDLTYSAGGFHVGGWLSSGDALAGNEFDFIVGYGGEVGDFSYDISLVSYIYPSSDRLVGEATGFGDFVEAIVSLGYGPVALTYYDNIESEPGTYALGEDYSYATLSASFGSFSAVLGRHDPDESGGADLGNPMHLDLSYAYNDNLSFTVSKLVDDEDSAFALATGGNDEVLFVVSYSLPIE